MTTLFCGPEGLGWRALCSTARSGAPHRTSPSPERQEASSGHASRPAKRSEPVPMDKPPARRRSGRRGNAVTKSLRGPATGIRRHMHASTSPHERNGRANRTTHARRRRRGPSRSGNDDVLAHCTGFAGPCRGRRPETGSHVRRRAVAPPGLRSTEAFAGPLAQAAKTPDCAIAFSGRVTTSQ